MQSSEIIITVIEFVVVIGSFLLGKYVFPKYKTNIQNAVTEFTVLLNYAESFVSYAKQFLTDLTGPEKMDAVVEKLKAICEQQGINVDEETLRAIGQKAYDAMKAGESSSKVIIETATEELKSASGVLEATATSTDPLPAIETADVPSEDNK